jgi:glycosyltransferase involved in cell wall biosynthesis
MLYCLYGVVAVAFALAGWRLMQAKRRFRRFETIIPSAPAVLPSVTVCIPARNESHAMTESLQRVLASIYPKLEILVIDDLSADATPALIRAFAQDGVRFIEGQRVPEGWLGKNHALNELLKEASGTYVLFLDVDTHLAPTSIEQLVTYAEHEKATMISIMPRREDGIRASTIFAPLRYFWELMFHRREAPAVASSAWLLNRRQFMADFEDFEKLKQVIQPEAHIAATYTQKHAYRFMISSSALGISHEKKWQSQVDTSVRLLYPLLGTRLLHSLMAMIDLLLIVSPIILGIVLVIAGYYWLAAGALSLYLFGAIVYASYLQLIWRRGWVLAALLWPVIVIQETFLIIISATKYRRGTVTWKGRPVTLSAKE